MENGEVSTRPLRSAKARDTLILASNGTQTWEPSFTYHGFRYVEITGWPNQTALNGDSITAIVVHSDMERTGYFESSHDLLNKFHENVIWSMKGNFLGAPTDCPQRDERLGWTGDAHAFMPTSNCKYSPKVRPSSAHTLTYFQTQISTTPRVFGAAGSKMHGQSKG
jgi:alpha-L-rhamnosidase